MNQPTDEDLKKMDQEVDSIVEELKKVNLDTAATEIQNSNISNELKEKLEKKEKELKKVKEGDFKNIVKEVDSKVDSIACSDISAKEVCKGASASAEIPCVWNEADHKCVEKAKSS
jgi:sugar-specific transcriptional regulator TrmB